ncbi:MULTISPECIES: LysR family transcriptional regulator [unclassified Mesorhizobium]|uniref:LysR family transcriptional regulator n=1 Tax=unclassified Mesorhizobium TaxID=325217 RepID=UPI000FDA1655|nr:MULTISPECIES: LysR family transcriptional regulator [unclassified Mesorhizobium]TGR47266.1 LysR family transcriptional regulator [bacterium M00.F.Ca.ET.199.01.1.1]TGU36720.1 LysR family transcriptional regulator [bacterium M00.F.Ca.ET.156.01.1.1]TGV87907.1 LysR family transcriptional regulator [Mesorhizobium sp. M00.F.Ca.ET.149.01.1.1]TGR28980.1 LysR family transcriptional regulator [Mesorhizobium sp. M8A.F.Ca.ET.202.01.1.1]TGR29794.1 LysR family transcriptional regulator [Mesorhizobium sp.
MDVVSALRTFLRVAQTKSFSAAALDLDLTQPAVSRQVSALEAHLKTRLLHRTTSALALTAEGEQMLPMALRVLEAVDALGQASGAETATVSGKVRLSLPTPLGLFIGDRLAGLLESHPALGVELIFRDEPSDLIANAIDLEVRLGPAGDSSLVCRRIGWTTAFLVASPSYLKGRDSPRTPQDIKDHACICYSRAGDGRSWSFSSGADDVVLRIEPRLVANNSMAVHRATLGGAGLAVLSHILVGADIEAGRLVKLMPDFSPTRLPINVVYPSRRNIPLRVTTVLDFLVQAVRGDIFMASSAPLPPEPSTRIPAPEDPYFLPCG